MATINPYLTFNGNCEEAFNFYKSVFGGDFQYVGRYGEMPSQDGLNPEDLNRIMHISLPIGKGNILMGADAAGGFGGQFIVGTNFSISVNADSEDEAHKLFNALAEGGVIALPIDKQFWGALFGMVGDRFGVMWMVNYDYTPASK